MNFMIYMIFFIIFSKTTEMFETKYPKTFLIKYISISWLKLLKKSYARVFVEQLKIKGKRVGMQT